MKIRGSLDIVSATEALGWLFIAGRKSVPVQAWLDGQIIGESLAEHHRPDLAQVGLGDGNCGFSIPFFRDIAPDYQHAIAVRPADCDLELPRTARADPSALLAAARNRFPAAGTHASIYGGLWTDRTDAKSLLAGRIAVAITPGELAAPLTQFIADGIMLLPADPGAASGTNGTYATLATAILTAPNVLAALRQILEDNPLVLAADLVTTADPTLYQPSTLKPLAAPAECLEIIVPLTQGVGLAVLRDSHRLPEFIAGDSRWAATPPPDGLNAILADDNELDDYEIPEATIAIVSPGLLHHLRLEAEAQAVRLLIVPRRQEAPLAFKETRRRQRVHSSGIALMI